MTDSDFPRPASDTDHDESRAIKRGAQHPGGKPTEQVDVTFEQAADAVLSLVAHGLEATQNRFHAPA